MAVLDILEKEKALELKLARISGDITFIEDCLSDNPHFGLCPEERERAPILLNELKVRETQLMQELNEVRGKIQELFTGSIGVYCDLKDTDDLVRANIKEVCNAKTYAKD